MAATIFVEQESGSYVGRLHPHNGYYAGDFGAAVRHLPAAGWHSLPSTSDELVAPAVSA